MPELLQDIRIIPFLYVNTAFLGFYMAIRCIAATAIIIEIICFKSITYSSKLFFLLEILFWVGRNEQ